LETFTIREVICFLDCFCFGCAVGAATDGVYGASAHLSSATLIAREASARAQGEAERLPAGTAPGSSALATLLLRSDDEWGALSDDAAAAEAWCAARFAPAELADAWRVDAAASGVLPSPPPCAFATRRRRARRTPRRRRRRFRSRLRVASRRSPQR